MLAALRRGYRRDAIRQAVDSCRRAGITVMLDLLIGQRDVPQQFQQPDFLLARKSLVDHGGKIKKAKDLKVYNLFDD